MCLRYSFVVYYGEGAKARATRGRWTLCIGSLILQIVKNAPSFVNFTSDYPFTLDEDVPGKLIDNMKFNNRIKELLLSGFVLK